MFLRSLLAGVTLATLAVVVPVNSLPDPVASAAPIVGYVDGLGEINVSLTDYLHITSDAWIACRDGRPGAYPIACTSFPDAPGDQS